jgi:soluble lytic murein transglycosylase-like protein
MLFAALLSGTAAHADVMEVGTSGFSWVAGGPAEQGAPAKEGAAVALTQAESSPAPAQWQPHVSALSAKYDLSPALIEALVWQESRWHPGAVSPVGATGLTQLMPGTARAMGVDPNDPEANLEGGARYLRIQLDTFGGDIEKALAAYNAGPGRVKGAGGIPAIKETQDYVAAILARLAEPVRR